MNTIACATGGGVRVGLEDNIYFDNDKKELATNLNMLKRIHTISEIMGREIMKPQELRKLLKLEKGYGTYGRAIQETKLKDEKRYAT